MHICSLLALERREPSLPLCPPCVTAFCDGNWATPLSFWGSTETLSPQSCPWRNAEGLTDISFKITKIIRRRAVDVRWYGKRYGMWCSCPASLGYALFPVSGQLINALWWVVSFKLTEKTWPPPRLLPLEISNMQQIKDWEGHRFLTGRFFPPKITMTSWKCLFHLEKRCFDKAFLTLWNVFDV